MPFSRVLRNFLIGYAILHMLLGGFFLLVITTWLRGQMLDQTRQRMLDISLVLRDDIRERDQGMRDPALLAHIQQLAEDTGIRFTLIADDGTVLADSRTGYEEIGDHGTRPEVLEARDNKVGFNERVSSTLGIRMMYLAIPFNPAVDRGQDDGFVRVAVEAESIHAAINSLQTFLWVFTAGLGLVAGVLMIVIAAREMRPLQSFAQAAQKIAAGQYESLPTLSHRDDEWKSLADAFSHMQSQLVERETRLRENNLRLEAVLGSMIEGVIAIDQNQRVVLANEAARQMLDHSDSELSGRPLFEVIRIPELQRSVSKALQTQESANIEFQTRGARRHTLNVRVMPLSSRPGFGAALVMYDITELRNLETMRRDFVANVSHELKTPLASIKAYAETLRLGAINDSENNLKFVEQIESQAELLNRQIRDLLQLSQVESGHATFDIRDVNLHQAVCECRDRFAAEARQREIAIDIDAIAADLLLVRVDREALQTILDNLVSNAIRYTQPQGFVKLSAERCGHQVKINVIDNGIGIAADNQSRVFERFYRVDKSRSRDVGGTGLGLAIVKHTVSAMKGQVEIQSKLGQGSTFTVTLPAA